MLFNSAFFIFAFMPTVLIGFYLIGRYAQYRLALCWLLLASLIFYGWWNPGYLVLLGLSIIINYVIGLLTGRRGQGTNARKALLIAGVTFNLGLLGYYKYAGFLVDTVNSVADTGLTVPAIVLPLAISFFTFQQIAYLVDVYRGEAHEYSFLHYCLFISFFPQLIAGPIVHHKEMMPQFSLGETFRLDRNRLAIGLSIFAIGLFKKVVIADSMAELTQGVYGAAETGETIEFLEAWLAATGYAIQIYFDFSGYSDMAIGIAWMFGVRLPLNFASPLRATSMIELWSTWHMTLSRFLRDYVYLPLRGTDPRIVKRFSCLMLVMLISGLWHGAAWTFVAWGASQGLFLVINHYWRTLVGDQISHNNLVLSVYRVLTFLAFVVGLVFFRADSFSAASRIFYAMGGGNGLALPEWAVALAAANDLSALAGWPVGAMPEVTPGTILLVVLFVTLLWIAPNTQQIMRNYMGSSYRIREPGNFTRTITWAPDWRWGVIIGLSLFASVVSLWETSEFIYYQF